MRKIFVTIAVAGLSGGSAYAQSSVTLYGLVNAGLTYISNAGGSHLYKFDQGALSGNRWGLKGEEDLGGGVYAFFTAESGFNLGTGAIGVGNTFFGRQVFVGMRSANLGSIALGRQYAPISLFVGRFESANMWAAAGAGYGAHPGNLDNLDPLYRINNAVTYQSPDYAGFRYAAQYSLGGVPGDFSKNSIYTIAARYAHGPFAAAAGYFYAKQPNFSFFGSNVSSSPTGNNFSTPLSPIFSGYASAASQQIFAAAAAYTIKAVTFNLIYSNTRFGGLGQVPVTGLTPVQQRFRGSALFNTGELNVVYQATPALQLAAAFHYTRATAVLPNGGANYTQLNLGVDYFLSKTTNIYLIAAAQQASGIDSTGKPAVAQVGLQPSNSNRQLVITTGLQVKF
ncbi:porin [Paraburkholderia sp. ZP32-5]|uniref:porin n=1 Tax=Paraburkholderia sp. ZP32-5 TaxID=2883245 RepID=UPI001F42CC08|nr:porin [Paraburkholderia sp. ZP32-5]